MTNQEYEQKINALINPAYAIAKKKYEDAKAKGRKTERLGAVFQKEMNRMAEEKGLRKHIDWDAYDKRHK